MTKPRPRSLFTARTIRPSTKPMPAMPINPRSFIFAATRESIAAGLSGAGRTRGTRPALAAGDYRRLDYVRVHVPVHRALSIMTFNPQSLYDALDAQRRERGLTWDEVAREICVSVSTIKGMSKRKWGLELDGVMGMARWVGRTVESFAGRDGGPPPKSGVQTESGRYIRFDTTLLYAAVDAERQRRGMTWPQVAAEIWPHGPWGVRQLRNLANGGRGEVYGALAICSWLGRTIQSFTKETSY